MVVVEDHGVGMNDVEQAKQPFFTTKPEMGRSGMGFAFMEAFMDSMEAAAANVGEKKIGGAALDAADMNDDGSDVKFRQAVEIAVNEGKISTSLLQRKLSIGYGKAAKIIDQMYEMGYVSEADGNKPRRILITKQEFYEKVVNDDMSFGGDQ